MIFTPDMNDGKHVFVFGSNLAGRHGAGAAWEAKKHWGAINGVGFGRQGMAYGIPTKSRNLDTLKKDEIWPHVARFFMHVEANPDLTFLVTRIGCGLAGYSDSDIAPMFSTAPNNCVLPEEWSLKSKQ